MRKKNNVHVAAQSKLLTKTLQYTAKQLKKENMTRLYKRQVGIYQFQPVGASLNKINEERE